METLRSVLSQSYPHIEVLVCDDDSTDGTYNGVRELGHPAVQVFRNSKRCGYVETMNRLLALAEGEFIVFLSDDDLLLPTMLEQEVGALDMFPSAGLVAPATTLINLHGRPISQHNPPAIGETSIIPGKKAIDNFLPPFRLSDGQRLPTSFPSTMFRKGLVNRVGKFSPRVQVACDLLLESKICLVSDMAYIPQPLFFYRVHDNWGSMMGRHGLYVQEFRGVFEGIKEFAFAQALELSEEWLAERQVSVANYTFSPSGGMARLLASFEGGYIDKARTVAGMLRATLSATPDPGLNTWSLVGLMLGLMIPCLPVKTLYRLIHGTFDKPLLAFLFG
jgi:glycosyltransferase involved in cell wall biosynthesis